MIGNKSHPSISTHCQAAHPTHNQSPPKSAAAQSVVIDGDWGSEIQAPKNFLRRFR